MRSKLNSIEKAEYISSNLKRYIKSTFQIEDTILNSQFNQRIDTEEIYKGPYISGRLPFIQGVTISNLIEEGVLSREFLRMPALHLNRPLHKHQEDAIRQSSKGHNLVVSTGTGSGKTESFLIPILNEIARDIELGKENRGIQALLLYPLNALANDQRSRVREILEDYPEITFGFFTGETEEKEKKAVKEYRSEFEKDPLPNEIISREVSRKNPPNILFTNYSMLEYLLIRPTDESLFSKENTSNWKFVVLDEAHTYVGALGIEISYLMKRLLGNINSNPKFILTSATLASDSKDFPSVIDFAEKLTSKKFSNESIIISQLKNYVKPTDFIEISPWEYTKLLDDKEVSNVYKSKFGVNSDLSSIEKIRKLILHSKDFYVFIGLLEKPIKAKKMVDLLGPDWNNQYLSDYLDLIAKINNNDKTILFDVRYHSFIRTLDGAYISLKPEKKLSLKKTAVIRHGEGDFIDDVLALQLGLCKYCNVPYILGHILDNRFYQIDDEDLYEVYGEESNNSVDILLIKEFVDTTDINLDKKIEYVLCNKCGVINDKELVNPEECGCGNKYKIELIGYDKTLDKKESYKNKTNIHKCISCESLNNAGVVNSFYIGKDSATAIIGQLLYQSMELTEPVKVKQLTVENPFQKVKKIKVEEDKIRKQYITFSDSRQQASFFALFFENQHIDFLRKKLVLESIKERQNVSIDEIQNYIQYRLENESLYPESKDVSKQGWISILIELLDVNRKFSLSGLGQISFNYDIELEADVDQLMEQLNDANRSSGFKRRVSYEEFHGIILFILNSMRRVPAIHYKDIAQISYETKAEHLSYRIDDRAGMVLEPKDKEKYHRSLLPSQKNGNLYTSYVSRALDVPVDESKLLLKSIWYYLTTKNIFKDNESSMCQNIDVNRITVSDGKFTNWYQCSKCKTITDLNLHNTCITSNCMGSLQLIDIDKVMSTNFYVNEYKNKLVEKIVIKEHTAQINNKEARQIQNNFKNGDINILSSSTTFEMGVDVGSLDTVYMRNVPPLPANYVQRAGRAGRSKSTAAFSITFASNNSHDYTFFEDPLKMIDGVIKAPYFDTNNHKISNRHITSYALALFFRKNPDYFNNSKLAVEEEAMEEFFSFVEEEKDQIIKFVEEANISHSFKANFSKWYEENIVGDNSKIRVMYQNHTTKIRQLEEAKEEAIRTSNYSDGLTKTLREFKNQSMLTTLSRYGVIPSYGFPVDSVSLNIPSVTEYKLDRDLATAISEYAPSSEIIVNKKKYRSRYVNVGGRKSLPNYYYVKCEECKSLTHSLNENDSNLLQCSNCSGENLSAKRRFVIPVNGFTSEIKELNDKTLKPKKTYSSDYYYIGNQGKLSHDLVFRNTIRLKSSKETELAVLNENNFYMCDQCGYTDLNMNGGIFDNYSKEHAKAGSTYICSNDNLRKCSLGHTFYTDVIIFDIMPKEYTDVEMRSFLYAVLEGISISLEIERNDINGLVQYIEGRPQLVLFDTVSGGAGHVSRLLDESVLSDVIRETFNKVNQGCCDETSSCYNCLRNYRNQRIHPFLKRGDAKRVAHDIQSLFNKNSNNIEYSIENDAFSVKNWSQINKMFEDEFISLEARSVLLPSNAYCDLIINGKRYEAYLVWEDLKMAVISNESESKEFSNDWNLYALNNLDRLIISMEV